MFCDHSAIFFIYILCIIFFFNTITCLGSGQKPRQGREARNTHIFFFGLMYNVFGKKIRYEALPSILSFFLNKLNKFNNTRTLMQVLDFVYHMTLNQV